MVRSIGGWNPQLFLAPDDGAGSGGGQQGDNQGGQHNNSNGGGQQGDNTQQPGAGNQGQGQQGNGQGGTKQFVYTEDRSDWVPRHRLNEQSTKFEREIANLRKEMQSSSQLGERLRAALDPNGGQNPNEQREVEETRAALLKLFPELGKLSEIQQAVAGSQQTTAAQWKRHATEMLTGLHTEAAKSLGVDELSATQKQRMVRLYRAEAQECAQARQIAVQREDPNYDFDNDFIARHERGDKTLLADFVKGIISDFYDPGKRAGSADATRRLNRPVPRGERTRQLPAGGPPQIDYNDENAFKKAIVAARNGGGGQ